MADAPLAETRTPNPVTAKKSSFWLILNIRCFSAPAAQGARAVARGKGFAVRPVFQENPSCPPADLGPCRMVAALFGFSPHIQSSSLRNWADLERRSFRPHNSTSH